jgi:hypothetical protein
MEEEASYRPLALTRKTWNRPLQVAQQALSCPLGKAKSLPESTRRAKSILREDQTKLGTRTLFYPQLRPRPVLINSTFEIADSISEN